MGNGDVILTRLTTPCEHVCGKQTPSAQARKLLHVLNIKMWSGLKSRPVHSCYMFLISKCGADWSLGLCTFWVIANRKLLRIGDFRKKRVSPVENIRIWHCTAFIGINQLTKRRLTLSFYATPLMTLTTDLNLSLRVSMFEHIDWWLGLLKWARAKTGRADGGVL